MAASGLSGRMMNARFNSVCIKSGLHGLVMMVPEGEVVGPALWSGIDDYKALLIHNGGEVCVVPD